MTALPILTPKGANALSTAHPIHLSCTAQGMLWMPLIQIPPRDNLLRGDPDLMIPLSFVHGRDLREIVPEGELILSEREALCDLEELAARAAQRLAEAAGFVFEVDSAGSMTFFTLRCGALTLKGKEQTRIVLRYLAVAPDQS